MRRAWPRARHGYRYESEERDPQRFWVSVLSAPRQTAAGSAVVRPLTAAPDLDGWAVVEQLLKDLESLRDRAWLVIDDVHELRSAEVLRQLELLLMRAPPELRCVLATRHDMRLGLHRLRLEGEVTEIRAANLRFTLDEARELFAAAGVALPESALTLLHARTEGWAAGLRLAALSLARYWSLAARLLSDHWIDLDLGGQAATARELLTAFPAGVTAADAELTALTAAAELARGSLEEAERQLALAVQRSASVPADRRGRLDVMLTVLRLPGSVGTCRRWLRRRTGCSPPSTRRGWAVAVVSVWAVLVFAGLLAAFGDPLAHGG